MLVINNGGICISSYLDVSDIHGTVRILIFGLYSSRNPFLLPRGISWSTVWMDTFVLPQGPGDFPFYTGNTNQSVNTGKALIEVTVMQMLGAKCA